MSLPYCVVVVTSWVLSGTRNQQQSRHTQMRRLSWSLRSGYVPHHYRCYTQTRIWVIQSPNRKELTKQHRKYASLTKKERILEAWNQQYIYTTVKVIQTGLPAHLCTYRPTDLPTYQLTLPTLAATSNTPLSGTGLKKIPPRLLHPPLAPLGLDAHPSVAPRHDDQPHL